MGKVSSSASFSKIGDVADAGRSFDAFEGQLSLFWRSEQTVSKPHTYEALTPAGLHIGCGIASIATHSQGLGDFAFQGAGLTAMLCPQGAQPFHTRIAGRTARAAGLFLASEQTSIASNDVIDEIKAALEKGSPLRASSSAPLSVISRLCAPVDPWFQGAARELAFEARALEMAALALSWLSGRPSQSGVPLLNERYAFAARELLESRLDHPPSLVELAREVGINVRSLTNVFRTCFGTSIAAYVTARRLDLAAVLMEQGMSPTAAAHRVGYTPSHLSNAFHRRYGIRPQDIRRAARFQMAHEKRPPAQADDIV